MKISRKIILGTLAIGIFCAVEFGAASQSQTAWAGTADKRQKSQHARIHQGVVSGSLTPHETHVLVQEQKHIQRVKARTRADGVVTPAERHLLNRIQNRASTHIKHLKHNP